MIVEIPDQWVNTRDDLLVNGWKDNLPGWSLSAGRIRVPKNSPPELSDTNENKVNVYFQLEGILLHHQISFVRQHDLSKICHSFTKSIQGLKLQVFV